MQQLPGGGDFIRKLPKTTLAYSKSGKNQDLYVYDGFKSNPKFVGKWLELTKRYDHPLSEDLLRKPMDYAYKKIEQKKKKTRPEETATSPPT